MMPSFHNNTVSSSAQATNNSTANANGTSNGNTQPTTNHATTTTSAEDNESTELTKAVDDLLEDIRMRFAEVNTEMLGKMDEMSRRLDNLEASMRTEAAQAAAQAAKEAEAGGDGAK